MDYIDVKYINLLSSRLEKFSIKSHDLYNCRCNLCGDSKKYKSKARGYFYCKGNNTNYKCHNCGANMSFSNYLKLIDPALHQQYRLEKYLEKNNERKPKKEEVAIKSPPPVFKEKVNLPRASENEVARKYLENRKLDPRMFYYAEKFKSWVNTICPSFNDVTYDEPRIVIPLYLQKKLIGVQGRALKESSVKYIAIKFSEKSPKIYGLDDIDKTKRVYILEGVFDSVFVKNSIAMCGADVTLDGLNISQPVYIYDNEPRNREIHSRMLKQIENGSQIVIWPSNIQEKDVNNMILAGIDVLPIIESNIYSDLKAKVKFNEWKRV